jgi:hypothetical protein
MKDICSRILILFRRYFGAIVALVLFIALTTYKSQRDSSEGIHHISVEELGKVQNLSTVFLQIVSDLLKEEKS